MKVLKTGDALVITRKNGTEIRVVKTPAGIAVHDSETGSATLHTGISKEEATDIVRELIESCQKAEIAQAEKGKA